MVSELVDPSEYDPLYLAGVLKFNECDYYECHEVWEELWTEYRGPARKFYQGLIQAAVALYHFGNGNFYGTPSDRDPPGYARHLKILFS